MVNVIKNRKGITRTFRKALRAAGHKFPLTGAFDLKIGSKVYSTPEFPAITPKSKVECVAAGTVIIPKARKAAAPVATTSNERALFKKITHPATETKRAYTRYVLAPNPKTGDGVTYFAKINNKWKEVPAGYADPAFILQNEAA
jgi:hypothetical protein